jgi:hypothetical protein
MPDMTLDENALVPRGDVDDFSEELPLELDATQEPDAIWEWDGERWVALDA